MNKLKLYVVRDVLVGDSSLILSAKNDAVLMRNVKAAMFSQQSNYLNTDTRDKQLFLTAELDTDTGIIVGLPAPEFVCQLEDLRLELVAEVKKQKEIIGDGSSENENE